MVMGARSSRGWLAWVLSAGITFWASVAAAQPALSLSGSVFRAGPDFATDTMGDPWDFSNVGDLDPHPDTYANWTVGPQARAQGRSVFLSNGRFQGTTDITDQARVSLLFRGWNHVVNNGRTGAFDHLAIPTARYGKLAIKMRYTNPAPSPNRVIASWYQRMMGETDELNNAGMLLFGEPKNGWGLYIVDLQTGQWIGSDGSLQTSPLRSPFGGGTPAAWEGSPLARGFEFRPESLAGMNVPVEVDWVRLTTRDVRAGAAMMGFTFNGCSGSYALQVTDADNTLLTVARGTSSGSGSLTFNYGVLAPGSYTATLSCANGTSAGRAFTVNAPPIVTVINPDVTGGTDFASDTFGNPWDMADAGDVASLEGVTNAGIVIDAGLPALQATATSTGDPRVTLLNGNGLVNSGRFRMLTFTLTLDTPFGLDGSQGYGSVARVLWSPQMAATANTMTTSNDILVWPGRETYTIDLGDLSAANSGIETDCGVCPQTPWASRAVRFLRLDPHESTRNVTFRLAQVKLAAVDEVAQGQTFPLRFRFDDPDTSSSFVAEIYLDADRNPLSGLRFIGSLSNVRPGSDITYAMTAPSDLPAGRAYYVYVKVTETHAGGILDSHASYSGGALRVLAASSQPVVTVSSPAPGSSLNQSVTITGCAYDAASTAAINVDQINAFAIAGPGVTGPQAGTTQVLGFGAGFGTLAFPASCPGASGAFANAGFTLTGIDALGAGSWTLRVMARSTLSGLLNTLDVPVTISASPGVPQGFTASAAGNTVTVAFGAPSGGPVVGGYLVEGALNPTFSPMLFSVPVMNPGVYSGALGNGTYYFRIVTVSPSGQRIAATAGRMVVVGPPPPPPPGAPTLSGDALTNPVALRWSPGAGGAPTSYTVVAGTTPGGSELVVAGMGLATAITANAPVGTTVYVRVIASNAGGSAVSNELQIRLTGAGVPEAPVLAPASVSGNVVGLSWTPRGGAPTSYVVVARAPGSPAIIGSAPVSGTSVSVPAPRGTYIVSVVAMNAAGASPESNAVTFVVP
jgi:hypothetical protein